MAEDSKGNRVFFSQMTTLSIGPVGEMVIVPTREVRQR